jgi:hypothetical protein
VAASDLTHSIPSASATSARWTVAPSFKKRVAIAAPRLRAAPVTTAICPVSLPENGGCKTAALPVK